LFGLDPSRQWDALAEKYELLRRLWDEQDVTWSGEFRTPLDGEFIGHGSALVGSPAQVLDKLHRYRELFGHQLSTIGVDNLPVDQQRRQLEWFAAEIATELRREYPDTLWQD
jgi:alkanesulfonate monooxygenase SsuD/methylene tetrahydromethanopterin reductase-like flavin-dependent oxidoreductase (luciferase family)